MLRAGMRRHFGHAGAMSPRSPVEGTDWLNAPNDSNICVGPSLYSAAWCPPWHLCASSQSDHGTLSKGAHMFVDSGARPHG